MTLRRLARGLAITIIVLLGLAGGAVYWLFYDTGPAPRAPYALDLRAIRAAALSVPGSLPTHVELEVVSHDAVPRTAMVSGTDWSKIDLARASYRIVSPNRSVIVDTGYD